MLGCDGKERRKETKIRKNRILKKVCCYQPNLHIVAPPLNAVSKASIFKPIAFHT